MISSLDTINALDEAGFVAALGDVFEHAPWVAARAAMLRPFATISDLHMAMFNAVRGQAPAARLAFFNAHPELGADISAAATDITAASRAEQGGLRLDQATRERLRELNAAYRARFGFPFILCARHHDAAGVLRELERRLHRDLASERDAAMHEIFLISRLRLADRVNDPDKLGS